MLTKLINIDHSQNPNNGLPSDQVLQDHKDTN